jgi:molybdopterin-binding protein
MKLSARNQIMGKVVSVQRGQTTGHVRIDIGNGIIISHRGTAFVDRAPEGRCSRSGNAPGIGV